MTPQPKKNERPKLKIHMVINRSRDHKYSISAGQYWLSQRGSNPWLRNGKPKIQPETKNHPCTIHQSYHLAEVRLGVAQPQPQPQSQPLSIRSGDYYSVHTFLNLKKHQRGVHCCMAPITMPPQEGCDTCEIVMSKSLPFALQLLNGLPLVVDSQCGRSFKQSE